MFSVMIVEDEIHILKYMQKKLEICGDFQVKGAFSIPEEALAAFDELQPEVVFLDIDMPSMNGIDLARRLLERKQDLRIIFTTAYEQYALDAFEVEAIDYLMKPIADEDIVRVTKRLNKATMGKQMQKVERVGDSLAPVRCFGCFELRDQQQQLVSWPTKKAEEVFAYFLVHQDQYVSKWKLLELFWADLAEERGFHNLYNTIYRIKQVLKKLSVPATIKKVNDGYILESREVLSDLGQLLRMEKEGNINTLSIQELEALFFSYAVPLFGMRDYIWSFPIQEYAARLYRKLCRHLLRYYREQEQFQQAENIVSHYISQHVEDEKLMGEWLEILQSWRGHEKLAVEYLGWFNEKLREAELPSLK